MKKIFSLLVITFLCIFAFGNSLSAQDNPLTAREVTKLFSGKTMTITGPEPDKKTGEIISIKAHASQDGFIRVLDEEAIGPAKGRIWSVTEEGKFCYSYKLIQSSRSGGRTCGFIVSAGNGVYNMYHLSGTGKKSADRNRKIVGGKGSKHIWTFSNFQ